MLASFRFFSFFLDCGGQMCPLGWIIDGDDVEILVLFEVALVEGGLHLVNGCLRLCQLLLHLLVLLLHFIVSG